MKKILTLLVLILLPAISFGQNLVTGFRASDKETYSRFVIDLNEEPKYKAFTLDNPPRVVIDIQNTKWDDNLVPHSETSRIKSVRYSPKSSPLRIVLDMNNPASIKENFILKPSQGNPHRLVIDITTIKSELPPPTPVTKHGQAINAPTPKPKTPRKPLIVIDAGHGGHDPGAIGYKKTQEKELTLRYAEQLRDDLLATKRYKVSMTRAGDKYLKLHERVEKARDANGDLFISIHANSHANKKISGLSVYTLSENASDKEAAALANKENKAGLINGVDLEDENDDITSLLIAMTQRETKNLSASFAETIVTEAKNEVKLLANPHRFAGFRVLTGADIPSVLIELGYITNKKEEKQLNSKNHRKKISQTIVNAIDEHFKRYRVED